MIDNVLHNQFAHYTSLYIILFIHNVAKEERIHERRDKQNFAGHISRDTEKKKNFRCLGILLACSFVIKIKLFNETFKVFINLNDNKRITRAVTGIFELNPILQLFSCIRLAPTKI